MKVLQRGEGWKLEIKCTGKGNGGAGCGSLLEVKEEDIYNTYHYDYSGERDTFYTIVCPVCGKETDIPNNMIPYGINASHNSKENVLRRYTKYRIF